MNTVSKRMAVCGLMTALGAGVMLLGGVIPIATFCCPALAGIALIPPALDCGRRWALSAYAAIALLSLLFCPDKEAALLFAFLGWYPVMKWPIDLRIRRKWPRRLLKLALWNACLGAMYALAFYVLRIDQILADYRDVTRIMSAVLLLTGNITLILYDISFTRFAVIYIRRFRPKWFR